MMGQKNKKKGRCMADRRQMIEAWKGQRIKKK